MTRTIEQEESDMNNTSYVKERMAVVMLLAVALALIVFVSPISAKPPDSTHPTITFVSHTPDGEGNAI